MAAVGGSQGRLRAWGGRAAAAEGLRLISWNSPEGPGTLLLRNQGLKTIHIVGLVPSFLDN